MVIAYEPVWAIGTGKVCEADEADRVCGLIRSVVAEVLGAEAAEAMYLAGRVCRLLGNRTAADNAFRDVVRSCRNSRKEWADKAAAELRGKGGAAER